MPQTELSTSVQAQLPEAVSDDVFSPDARKQAMDIVAHAQWSFVSAVMEPAKNMVAWLGFDIGSRNWWEIVKAKDRIRRLSVSKNEAPVHVSQAANDSHIHEKHTGTNG